MNDTLFYPVQLQIQSDTSITPAKTRQQNISAYKPLIPADFRELSTFCTNQTDLKGINERKVINSAISYCLNNQARVLATLNDIGQFLKLLTESTIGLNFDSTSRPNKNTRFLSAKNSQFQYSNAKSIAERCLQPIIENIQSIQTELRIKLQELDASHSTDCLNNFNFSSKADSPITDYANHSAKSAVFQKIVASPTIENHVEIKNLKPHAILNGDERLTSFQTINQQKEEANNTSNCTNHCDMLITDNSHIVLHNTPSMNCEQINPSKNFERYPQSANTFIKAQNNPSFAKKPEPYKSSNTISTVSAANPTANANSNTKQKLAPGIKLNFLTKSKGLGESTGQRSRSHLKLGEGEDPLQKKNEEHHSISAGLLKGIDERDGKGAATARFGLSSDKSEARFISAKNTSREQYNTPRDSARSLLNALPKKVLTDESLENMDRTIHTVQVDDGLVLLVDGKTPFETEPLKHPTRDRLITKSDSPFEKYGLNTAQKERAIIKTLMKDQYGEGLLSSYHKADHGSLYQKKYLINAKWWREWRDFVNFEADDKDVYNNENACLHEIKSYSRPGSINNRTLLKQDAIADPETPDLELELKENLLEHHDFEAVNKKIYELFSKWYGSDFEICRVLRPDPFRSDKHFLDLYPRKRLAKISHPKSMDLKSGVNNEKLLGNIVKINIK